MKLIADEHFPSAAVRILAQAGFDVLEICRTHSSSSDPQVLEICMETRATLLTMDKGFGTLTFRDRLPAACGIILFRLEGTGRSFAGLCWKPFNPKPLGKAFSPW